MSKITKEMIISDILNVDENLAPILMESGMHCLGCPSASGESLEDACAAHGIDVDNLIGQLNSYLESK